MIVTVFVVLGQSTLIFKQECVIVLKKKITSMPEIFEQKNILYFK